MLHHNNNGDDVAFVVNSQRRVTNDEAEKDVQGVRKKRGARETRGDEREREEARLCIHIYKYIVPGLLCHRESVRRTITIIVITISRCACAVSTVVYCAEQCEE